MNYKTKWVPARIADISGSPFLFKAEAISFGQCIAQASRLRSMLAPIPFGIGVDADKSFGTRWFVDHMTRST